MRGARGLNGICEGGYYRGIGVMIYQWLEAVSVKTVSYTHLDVYKRQVVSR